MPKDSEVNQLPVSYIKKFLRSGEIPEDLDLSSIPPNQLAALFNRRQAWQLLGSAKEARDEGDFVAEDDLLQKSQELRQK